MDGAGAGAAEAGIDAPGPGMDAAPQDAAPEAGIQASAGQGGSDASAGLDAGADAATDAARPISLKEAAARTGRLMGAALGAMHLMESDFAATAAAELSFATPENEMKWATTEPVQNQFDFGPGDAVVAFAQQNGIQVKGHTLVWHSQLPSWVSAITDASTLHQVMINHIFEEVLHYSGQVMGWDVVNEAVADDGQSLRNTIFYQLLGPTYIDDAFNAAHAADPNARLYYNDYGAEGAGAKSDYVYNLVQGMLARGVPINGVGLQMHTGPADTSPSAAQLATNMKRLAALGLDVLITEMDVQICSSDVDTQATRFHDIVAACVAQPACKAVTVWGVPDKYSWLNNQTCATPHPLLFDDNYNPKPARMGVLNALLGY
jgi:endo-1,4-beta-xylanase